MNNPALAEGAEKRWHASSLRDWLYLAGAAAAAAFWGFTMYGLPPRVDRLEEKVAIHDERLTRSDVKMDIVLDDVKTIKSILMQFSRER